MRTAAGPAQRRRILARAAAGGDGPLFENLRRIGTSHTLAADALAAAVLLALCTVWLVRSGSADWQKALVQLALVAPLAWRRSQPSVVFSVIAVIALAQWALGYRLIADASLLVALYSVAVHDSRGRSLTAAGVMEVGAVLAATRWRPASTGPRSFLFLTATVVAALFVGFTVRSGSEYMGWLAERADRLELERDQQASLGAATERARIAREMHDIVAHSLSVVVTLADAASIVGKTDPARATEAMEHVSAVGRQALSDMRQLIGVLRTESDADLAPPPTTAQLDELVDRLRATGLDVTLERTGEPFELAAVVELSLYRIVQEALTNTLKHSGATTADIVLRYDRPLVALEVLDNGAGAGKSGAGKSGIAPDGHGIEGMRERANLHGGSLSAGPRDSGGWLVTATVVDTTAPSR